MEKETRLDNISSHQAKNDEEHRVLKKQNTHTHHHCQLVSNNNYYYSPHKRKKKVQSFTKGKLFLFDDGNLYVLHSAMPINNIDDNFARIV